MSIDKLSFFVSPRRNRHIVPDVPMGHPMIQLLGHPMIHQIVQPMAYPMAHPTTPKKEYIRCAFVLLTENPTHDPQNKYQCIVRVSGGKVAIATTNLSGRDPDDEINKLMASFGVNKSYGKFTYLEHVENYGSCITYKIGVLYIRKVSCSNMNVFAGHGYQIVRFNFKNYAYITDLVTSNILHAISNLTYKLT